MQDLVGGDNNRTPIKCQGADNCNIVGDVTTPELKIYASNQFFADNKLIPYLVHAQLKNFLNFRSVCKYLPTR
jgi:hypothetical protein